MKYDIMQLPLISNERIADEIFDMRLEYNGKIPVECGQFAHIYVPSKTLRRPISVCDASDGVLRLVYQVKGEGTRLMSEMKAGQVVDALLPLGHGFTVEKDKKYCLIGGGIGVPPMLYTAKKADNPLIITGFRTASLVCLQEDLKPLGELVLVTDDGSAGKKGFVTDVLRDRIGEVDEVLACGPMPMLKAVAAICAENDKPCKISLEERMACGIGACLGCAVKVRKNGEEVMLHVCKNGPVFNAEEVVF